jgi:uncharacterized protein (DUF488 family)
MERVIFTIGYEGITIDAFLTVLRNAGVKVLMDVRAVPLSRKPGFSKNKLAAHLASNDIAYIGLRDLGTPAAGRAAARKGRISEMRAIFSRHLKTQAAQEAVAEAVNIAEKSSLCLLCFERRASECHRLLIADEIARKTGLEIVHLDPIVASLI